MTTVGVLSRTTAALPTGVAGLTVSWDQTVRRWKRFTEDGWVLERDVIDLRDYQARFDDSTDNTTPLTNALAALPTSGGIITGPSGICRFATTVALPLTSLTLAGPGETAMALKYTGAGSAFTYANDASTYPLTILNLYIWATASTGVIVDLTKPSRLFMQNVRIYATGGSGSTGLRITGSDTQAAQYNVLDNVMIFCNGVMTTGLALTGSALPGVAGFTMRGGRIMQTNGGTGVSLATVVGASFHDVDIEGHVTGMLLDGAQRTTIDGCWFESNTTADIIQRATSISSFGTRITRCIWATSTGYTTNIDFVTPGGGLGNSRNTVQQNGFAGKATTANVRMQTGCQYNMVTHNSFSDIPDIVCPDPVADQNTLGPNVFLGASTMHTEMRFAGAVSMTRIAAAYTTTVTINTALGNHFDITVTDATAFTVANPSLGLDGMRIGITVRNASGTTTGVTTFGTLYKMSAWTAPANTTSRTIDFKHNGVNWVEASRTPSDVPN